MAPFPPLTKERVMAKVDVCDRGYETPCWLWQPYKNANGYGVASFKGRAGLAHRATYELWFGSCPPALDHLCRERSCVNPYHLEGVTHLENMRRSLPAQKTHCAHGHPFDEVNTYIRATGGRDCRACGRERTQRYLARKAQAA